MTGSTWPRQGNCGACGRDAEQVPSGRWWHKGRPCRARSQTMWSIDDTAIQQAAAFIPEGEPLPTAPGWHMHTEATDEHGSPTSFGICHVDHTPTVREFLAREAEEATR